MLDQRLDRAERLGQREQPRPADDLERRRPRRRRRVNDTMPPKSRIWRGGDVVAGMVGRGPGYSTRSTAGCSTQHLGDRRGVGAVAVHAHRERLDAAQHEVAVERRRHRADRVLQEPEPLGELGVVGGDEAADDVGVAAEVLGGRVHDDVGAERERLLQVRRGERVVDDDARAARVRELARPRRCRRSTSAGLVGVSIQTSRVSSGHAASSASRSVRSTAVHARPCGVVHLVDEPERAAVRVVGDDHVVARAEQCAGSRPRRPGRSRTRARAARPRATRGTPRARRGSGCRCARTRSPVLADRVLGERRRQRDRRHDRAGRGIGLLAGVDGAGLEESVGRRRLMRARRGSAGERNASTSERLSTPIGWPPSSTSTAGAVSSSSTASCDRLADADRRQRRAHDLLDRPVEHVADRGTRGP